MNAIDYTLFEAAIIKHNLRDRWSDSWRTLTEREKDTKVRKKYLEAKKAYTRMMLSPKSSRSAGYRRWALGEALGTKPTKANTNMSLYSRERK